MTIERALREAISGPPTEPAKLDIDAAIKAIFVRPSRRYFFLFNQNLRRTNLQVAELIALLRVHIRHDGVDRRMQGIEISCFDDIKALVEAAFDGVGDPGSNSFRFFCDEITHFLENKVIVQIFHGSACVYLPIGMTVDEGAICGESGYIHSCGELLLVRNSSKSSIPEFEKAIEEAIDLLPKDSKFMVVPYCHEDFSNNDRGTTPFLDMGLDDVKINVSKAYVGEKKLFEVLDIIADKHENTLIVAPADYKQTRSEFENAFPNATQNTIWVICDSEHRLPDRFPSEKKYYIVYLQRYKNSNQYHIYDVNKPAWASHTTLPHSLAGAMLNIARPWFDNRNRVNICDPFCGSGTLLFETQKFDDISCIISDRAPIFDFVVRDNARFFNLNNTQLQTLLTSLNSFKDEMPDDSIPKRRPTNAQKLYQIRKSVGILSDNCNGDFLQATRGDVEHFFESVGLDILHRIIAYVVMRVRVRGAAEISRQSKTWITMYRREINSIIEQINNHLHASSGIQRNLKGNPNLMVTQGSYSDSIIVDRPEVDVDNIFTRVAFHIADIEKLPVNSYDAIITDPPYGFNTDEDYWQLSAFMRKMVEHLVCALRPTGGQLILAAPQQSFSGRTVIPFVRSLTLGREIIRFCYENDRECSVPAMVVPGEIASVRPPYYWIAEKTLQRKILHFWIRQKAQ